MKLISIVRVVVKKLVKGGVKYFNINKKVKINFRKIVIPVRGGVGASNLFIDNHET